MRLFNRRHSRFRSDDLIHEEVICPGRYVPLAGVLLHWRNVTFMGQMLKDLENAKLEAEQMATRHARAGVLHLIIKPLARFGWCYLIKRAFLHGSVGLMYALLIAHADVLRTARLWGRPQTRPARDPLPSVRIPADMPEPSRLGGTV